MYIYIYILQTQICTERNWTYSNPAWTREKEFNAIGKRKAVVYLSLCLPCSLLSFVKSIFATPIRKRQRVINRDRGTSNEDGKRRRDGIKKKNGRRREEPRVYERWDSCVTRSWRRGRKEGGRKRKENGKPETSSSFYRRSWLAWSWMNWREESRKEKFRERQFASIHEWNETRHRRINTKFLNAFVRDPEIGIEDVAGHTRNLTMNS